jgi:hypothetical protein
MGHQRVCKTPTLRGFFNLFLAFPRLGVDAFQPNGNNWFTCALNTGQVARQGKIIENARFRSLFCTEISTGYWREKSRPK